MTSFYNPVKVSYLTPTELTQRVLTQARNKSIALFANHTMIKRLGLDDFVIDLKKITKYVVWIDETKSNPTYIDIFETLQKFKGNEIEEIYAVGGGSVIDTAKAIKALYYLIDDNSLTSETILSTLKERHYLKNINDILLYAIPTTAGTGSEMTKWATVWDKINANKYSVDADYLYPVESYLVPEFTDKMPPLLTISTGLDALSHAIESFWAKSSNEIVQGIALSAIRMIVEYLPKVKEDLNNLEYRKKMLTASTLAGLAFSQTRTTAAHSISYPLTMLFDIDHGLAVNLVLPYVMEINMQVVPEIKQILEVFQVDSPIGVREWLVEICKPYVDLRLNTFGVKQEDIERIVELSVNKGRMANNPVDIIKIDVDKILKNLL